LNSISYTIAGIILGEWLWIEKLAEVVGSNLTQFIFINLVNYGIEVILFLDGCRTKPSISISV
jgi:hypothetical protein